MTRLAPLLAGRRRAWMTRVIQAVVDDLRQELREATGPVRDRADLLEIAVDRILASDTAG